MTLSSAYEDFRQRTLASLPGVWARLRYIAGLRLPGNGYQHWGLSRTFGADNVQKAVGAVHSELFLELLRTPLRQLSGEFDAEKSSQDVLDWSLYVPAEVAGGSLTHFNSIVSTLMALSETRRL